MHIWDLPQTQANLALTDHTFPLEQRWDLPWAGHLCVCLCVCLWVHRFYREKDPRHNNKQRGNQFNGQLGKQVLTWQLGV